MADAVLTLRPPLIEGDKSIAQVTHDVCAPMEARPTGLWWAALAVSSSLLLLGAVAIAYQIAVGVGTSSRASRVVVWRFGAAYIVRVGLTVGSANSWTVEVSSTTSCAIAVSCPV